MVGMLYVLSKPYGIDETTGLAEKLKTRRHSKLRAPFKPQKV